MAGAAGARDDVAHFCGQGRGCGGKTLVAEGWGESG